VTRRALASIAAALAGAVLFVGCGAADRDIDPDASEVLQGQVASARAAVAAGDPQRASRLLRAIDDTVGGLRADAAISDRKAADVLAALGEVQDALHAWVATSTTASTSTTLPEGGDRDRGRDGNNDDEDEDDG
jgi:hypothetical protein